MNETGFSLEPSAGGVLGRMNETGFSLEPSAGGVLGRMNETGFFLEPSAGGVLGRNALRVLTFLLPGVSTEPFSHGTGTQWCLQKEMATYRH